MPLAPGTRLGAYEILGAIGAGGMGEVYRATDTNLARQVAIKVLPESVASDPERLARFDREAKTLASLNHPNIAQIHGLERVRLRPSRAEDEGIRGEGAASVPAAPLEDAITIALVMELVEGPTLADRIAHGPIPVNDALPIARQIAEALEAAHERGIIHRDLKPANIKVRDDGTVKVLDFGLAKALERPGGSGESGGPGGLLSISPTITTPAMTAAGLILGTAAYMSPEQARGKPVDRRTDIWAFGCIVYEMLTGCRAFAGDDVAETLADVMRVEPAWERLPDGVSPSLVMFLKRSLHKDPQQRVHDVADMRLAMAGAFDTIDGATSVAGPAKVSSRLVWRWALLLLTFTAGGVAVGVTVRSMTPVPVPTVARFIVPLPADQAFTNSGRQAVAVAPDGTKVVYVANRQLYVRSLSDFDVRPIPGTDLNTSLYHPVFSPDGQWIAFASAADGGTLKKVAVGGGAASTLCPAEAPIGMSWGPDGIVFGQSRGIMRVSEAGGEPDLLVAASGETLASPQMLPGGREVLFTATSEGGTDTGRWDRASVIVQTLGSGERHMIVRGSDARYLSTGHLLYAIQGSLLAVPFDVSTFTVTGSPVPVLSNVLRSGSGFTPVTHASVSESGVLAYVPGTDTTLGWDLAWLDRNGGVEPLGLTPREYATPRVSPDGRHLAYTEDFANEAGIWILDVDAPSAPRKLTLDGQNRFPVWSPDSARLAFQADREGDAAIFWQDADGTAPAERLTTPEPGSVHIPYSWSREGVLLFGVEKASRHALWALSLAGRTSQPFGSVESGQPSNAVFSPDGHWVAYAAGEGGNRVLFVQPFPATGARYQVSPTEFQGVNPMWSPDGTELFYGRGPEDYVVVQVTTEPRFSFSPPAVVPSGNRIGRGPVERTYDIDPTGRGFIIGVAPGEGDRSPQIRIVTNWLEELKRLVPVD